MKPNVEQRLDFGQSRMNYFNDNILNQFKNQENSHLNRLEYLKTL